MALYDNFLNPENMYRRPSETMNTVSNYLGTNQATMPMGNNNLSTMMGMPTLQGGGAPFMRTENQSNDDDNYSSQEKNQNDLVAQFVGQVQGLSENQKNLLLQFVKSDVDNVFAYQAQQTGFEQENARQARLQQVLSSPVMGRGLGRGERNSLARRQLQDTYRQRIANVQEDTGRRYDQLLQDFNRSVGRGFSTAADIIAEDPSTTSTPYNQRYRVGEEITIGGERYVWNGTEFVAGEIFDSEQGDV